MKKFVVNVKPEQGWWIITIPELDGITSHAKNLKSVESVARDLIATWLDAKLSTVSVTLELSPPSPVAKLVQQIAVYQSEEERARSKTKEAQKKAVRILQDMGLTVRETGELLHLSHQRISQIANEDSSLRSE